MPAHRLRGPIASRDEASYRLAHLSALKAFAEAYEADLRTWAEREGGVDTEGGTWGPVTTEPDTIVTNDETLRVIADYLGPEGVRVATASGPVSRASIERAVRARNMAPVARAVREIVDALRAAGLVTKAPRVEFTVRRRAARDENAA